MSIWLSPEEVVGDLPLVEEEALVASEPELDLL